MDWFKLWPSAYLNVINRISDGVQRGAFSLLLFHCLNEGSLPNDDEEIAYNTGLPVELVTSLRPHLKRLATVEGDCLVLNIAKKTFQETAEYKAYVNSLRGDWLKLRLVILERDRHICGYCGEIATCVDHILARKRGGNSEPENLISACKSCNSRKRHRTPEEAGMVIRWKTGGIINA